MNLSNPLGSPLQDPMGLGLPVGSDDYLALLKDPAIVDFINGASGNYEIPKGIKFFRVTAVGAGGGGQLDGGGVGGGGGGLAQSAVIPVDSRSITIIYTAAPTAAAQANGATSTAEFLDVKLYGFGGNRGFGYTYAAGGAGFGGKYNFTGGTSSTGGGGAAGTRSNGGGAWVIGDAGGGGSSETSGVPGYGGGGVGQTGGYSTSQYVGSSRGWAGSSLQGSVAGGGWGGGGGSSSTAATGGYGGVRIELWA